MRLAKAVLAAALAAALGGCLPPAVSDAESSDAGIRARLEQTLRSHRNLDLHAVTIDVHSHVVTISGIAASWEDKRLIEKIARDLPGVEQALVNLIISE